MKCALMVICGLSLACACYFAFSGTGDYTYEGVTGQGDTLAVGQPGKETVTAKIQLARYRCHNPLCWNTWLAPPGGMPCPLCDEFADDFDLIDDDELD